ncbi:MAG: cupin domain-containing protein [Ruminococcaceae bacterium]|nr:cupin domain-containing protein [Oscillospiraceae bacterium]
MTGFAIGAKIKALRIKNGLTQEELANRSELSKGFISQVESEQTSPSIATLVDILECLGTNLTEFFSDATEERVVFTKEDYFINETPEEGRLITWLIPNCQKNDMEPIILELAPGGVSPNDEPHAGEEFGYVLSGAVQVIIGKHKYKAKKGESFYFAADENHSIANIGNSTAKILWISTPPSF